MKITKRQLRRIIKEEKQKLLNENVPSALGMEILSIKDVTPMAHNGSRPPKKRRV